MQLMIDEVCDLSLEFYKTCGEIDLLIVVRNKWFGIC